MRDCKSQKTCQRCRGRHNTLLHTESRPTTLQENAFKGGAAAARTEEQGAISVAAQGADGQAYHTTMTVQTSEKVNLVLMATARVVLSANGRKVSLRALHLKTCGSAFALVAGKQRHRAFSKTPRSPWAKISPENIKKRC